MKEFWDERFGLKEYVYGETPNAFLQEYLDGVPAEGKALFTAEGEGRNATYAALKGWEVQAFDYSVSAKAKAEQLMAKHGVTYGYRTMSAADILEAYPAASFDLIAVIYNHFPPAMRVPFHHALMQLLKPGGRIVMEVFNTRQIGNPSGGPQVAEMLYDPELLAQDFQGLEMEQLEAVDTVLHEGNYHSGAAAVTRMVARKPH